MRPIPKSTPSGLALLIGAGAFLAGCGGGGGSDAAGTLLGAGSTLVAPLVAKWSAHASPTLTYGAIGSAGGIAQVTGRTVDFGASDAPLTPAQAEACHGCVQVPWALAATLLAYHGAGLPDRLKLSGPVLAGIFLGGITHWNDPAIARLNPGVKLPDTPVTPVYRSDGSGDTYAFSDYLSKISPEWKRKLGLSTQIRFPSGIGARGNQGVAAAVARTNGGIGYVASSYVFSNHLRYALVQNAAGRFAAARVPSIASAAAAVKAVPPNKPISITDPPASAPGAYPISTFTYAIVPKSSGKAKQLRAFLSYAIGDGQRFGPALHYAPLPPRIREADRKTIAQIE